MGSYPVFAKVDFDFLQRFKEEFNVATDEDDLDLILRLHSIFSDNYMLFIDVAEFHSKSYWGNIAEMPLLREFTTEDGSILRFIKFGGIVDYLLPSEELRSEIAQKVKEISSNIEGLGDLTNTLINYKNLDTFSGKAYYIGNLICLLKIVDKKMLRKEYEVFYELDARRFIEKIGYDKLDFMSCFSNTSLVEDDLLVIYGV